MVSSCEGTQQEGIEGVLLDGTPFVLFAPGLASEDARPDGLVVLDPPGTEPRVVGVHLFDRIRSDSPSARALAVFSDSWKLEIDVYPEVEAEMQANGWDLGELLDMRDERGLPVVTVDAPLRLALPEEAPRQVEVQYGPLAVRRGCDPDRAALCSDDRRLQVVLVERSEYDASEVRIESG